MNNHNLRDSFARLCLLLSLLIGLSPVLQAQTFVHPGGMHTQADFDRMKAKVAANASPWVDSYNQLTPLWLANLNMPWAPVTQIIRGGTGSNYARSQKDALAIYYLALRWRITGDTNYAEEAIRGCDAWSSTMTNGVGGDSNWALGAGICGYEFAVGGEALRGYTNWSQASISNYSRFLRIFGDGNDSFLNNHNGTCDSHYWANWDACNLASLISVAVFTDDTNRFNRAITYLKQGRGNGNLTAAAWFVHTNGLAQWEESGRDQPHAMDGIAWLGVACQVAWNQGVDLFGFDNNLFLRGLEYSAKYNLWNDVPYQTFLVCEGNNFAWGTTALASGGRGFLPPTWDLFYNHYVNVRGLSAPWTAQAAAAMRPDGFYNNVNSPDFLGFTTLTCLRDPIPAGAISSGVEVKIYGTNVLLNWWGSATATNYLIKRATVSGGPYTTIASLPAATENAYFDTTITTGRTYYYVVSAQDKFGDSANSPEKKIGIEQLRTYYRFNETSGTTASDASGLSPSATLVNGASFTASGKFGNGVSLNGSSQYVALPNGLITGLGDATISAWVYLNSQNTWARIFDFGADTDRYMFLSPFNSGGGLRFAITKFTGAGEQGINGPAVSLGTWHHVAVTLKADNAGSGVGTLYLDGVGVATNTAMTFTPDMIGRLVNATNNYIGRSQWPGDPYLNGRVDDFRIYNGALSAADIAALYALSPVVPAAPANAIATAVSANAINLTWTPSATATSYLVQRSLTSGGPYTVIASGVTDTNYIDAGLLGSTTYYYVIAAANNSGTSTNSPEASATTLIPPPTPTSLTATGNYNGEIVLNWNASAGATSYNVKRSMLSGGPYVTVATGVNSAGYTNSGLILNATYYYVVSAVNANGESLDSNEAGSIVPVPTLVWKGNVSTNWDVNQTTNWLFGGSPSTYFVDGATANFDDTATTSTVNLADSVAPYSVTFSNSTLNYTVGSANSSAIGGAASITKLGSGTTTLTGNNTFTGDIFINGGGTLAIGGAGTLGGGDYSGNLFNYSTFNYSSTATQTLSGIVSQTGTLLKSGSGTLNVSGNDAHTGATTVRQGTLNLTGSAKSGSSGIYVVDNNAASTSNAKLNISTDVTAARMWLGDRAGAGQAGAAYQTDGNVVLTQAASVDDLRIGSVAGGRGYYKLSGGTLTANEVGVGASQNDTIGIFDITGGTFTDNGWLAIAHGGATSSGLLNITGGSASAARVDMNWSGTSGAISVINVGGGNNPASLTAAPSTSLGVNLASASTTAGTISVVNLLTNGTLTTGTVRADQANPTTLLNFNGGRLQANINSGTFLTDGKVDGVYIYSGGATIDNSSNSITIDRPLLAPTGVGVISISGPSVQGSGYVAPPFVTITGGTGSGATATAVMADDGTGKGTFAVASIVVSSRGVYSVAPTNVTLTGGGASTAASGFTINTAANVSGGVTFKGAGTTALSGANSYTGPTVIAEGTVKLGGPLLHLSFDSTNGTTVINDGSGGVDLDGTLTGTNVSIVAGGHSGNALQIGNSSVKGGYVLIPNAVVPFNVGGTWSWGMWIKSTTAGGAYLYQGDGGWASGNSSFYLNPGSAASGTKGGGVRWGQGWETGTATLNDGSWHFIAMTCTNGTKTFYVDGAVDAWTVNAWTGNGTGSQLWIGGTADTGDGSAPFNGQIDDVYVFGRALSQPEITNIMNGVPLSSPILPTASAVTVASGATLDLDGYSATVSGLSGSGTINNTDPSFTSTLTVSNNAVSSFNGTIQDTGAALSLVKTGSGSLSLLGANTYSGITTINNGELILPTAFAGGGNVNVSDNATLGITNSSSASATVSALTLGNGGSAALELFNVSSTATPLIQAASVTLNGTCVVQITGAGGLVAGNTYPLIAYSGSFDGNFASLQLPSGVNGALVSSANLISLGIAPVAPTGLTTTAGNAQVALNWNASSGATSYNIKRAIVNGGPYTIITNVVSTSYTDANLLNGTTYYYVVSAANAGGESADSTQSSATPQPPIPSTPTGLLAIAGNTQVALSWNSSSGATSYNVKRAAINGGPYITINNITTTSYTDTAVTNGTTYYYVVSALNGGGESGNSSQASATPQASTPPAPTGLTAVSGNQQATLSWIGSTNASSYNVKRSTVRGSGYTTVTNVSGTSAVDSGLNNGTAYYYVVSASNAGGESANSSEVSVTPSDLFGYWKFDETSGTTAADSSGNGNNATAGTGTTWISGISSNAVDLNGTTSGYVTFPAGLVRTLNDFSVAAFVKIDTNITWSRIFDFGSGTGSYMFLTPASGGGTVRYAITTSGSGSEQQINSSTTLSTGVWHHVAVTLSGTTGILYIDGVAVGTNTSMTFKPSSLGSTTQNYIGDSQFAADPNLNGSVDEFRIYARALSASEVATFASDALPSPWETMDVGAVAADGAADYVNGTFTIEGAGTNISGTADAFRFVYQPSSGDCSNTVRVVSLQSTNANAKAGVMIRESLAPNAREAGMWVTPTSVVFTYRSSTGGSTTVSTSTGKTAPYWVRIARTGNSFAGYYSANGTSWTRLGSKTISMSTGTYIGMGVESGVSNVLNTATMDSTTTVP